MHSANLAFALSQEPGTRVLAIDICLPFGDLDMYLTGENHSQDLQIFPVRPHGLTGRSSKAWRSISADAPPHTITHDI